MMKTKTDCLKCPLTQSLEGGHSLKERGQNRSTYLTLIYIYVYIFNQHLHLKRFSITFPCIIIKMSNRVTISHEISLICTLLYIDVLKYQLTININMEY